MVPTVLPGLVRFASIVAPSPIGTSGFQVSLARPKSSTLAAPRLVMKMLAGLDVATHDTFAMCGVERIGDLDGVFEQLLEWERARLQAVLQGLAAQHFHHDELLAAVQLFQNAVVADGLADHY